jgi:hypothetical protein
MEAFHGHNIERAGIPPPDAAFNRDVWLFDANDVE